MTRIKVRRAPLSIGGRGGRHDRRRVRTCAQHPYIYPVERVGHTSRTAVIRTACSGGSLRDAIYRTKPKLPFFRKYYAAKGKGLEEKLIQQYGRQILEALAFLHGIGLCHGHLHAGNVLLDNGVCRLTDLENTILGLPPRHKPFLLNMPRLRGREAIDVYSFGLVLYEMVYGCEMLTPAIATLEPHKRLTGSVRAVLEMLVTRTACYERGMPTVARLLATPLFGGAGDSAFAVGEFKCKKSTRAALDIMMQRRDAQMLALQEKAVQFTQFLRRRRKEVALAERYREQMKAQQRRKTEEEIAEEEFVRNLADPYMTATQTDARDEGPAAAPPSQASSSGAISGRAAQ